VADVGDRAAGTALRSSLETEVTTSDDLQMSVDGGKTWTEIH
jgi:hypothetical protein